MSILEFLRPYKNFKRYDGEIGIEIETETKEPYDSPAMTFWHVKEDGSLRNFGREYILKQPVKYNKELDLCLDEFSVKTKSLKFLNTYTTSVHIHLNILNESFKTMGNFLTLYALFENLLIRYSGEDRLSNLFCLPIVDAEETYKNVINMFLNIEKKQYKSVFLTTSTVKYAALNLGAIGNYGSLEIRSFRGETDIKIIKTWVSLLYSMMEYARKNHNPKDIMLNWKNKKLDLITEIFGKNAEHILYKDSLKLIEKDNVYYAAAIAYSIPKSWDLIDKQDEQKNPKEKDLQALARKHFGADLSHLDEAQIAYLRGLWRQIKTYTVPLDFGHRLAREDVVEEALAPRPARNRLGDIAEVDVLNDLPIRDGIELEELRREARIEAAAERHNRPRNVGVAGVFGDGLINRFVEVARAQPPVPAPAANWDIWNEPLPAGDEIR